MRKMGMIKDRLNCKIGQFQKDLKKIIGVISPCLREDAFLLLENHTVGTAFVQLAEGVSDAAFIDDYYEVFPLLAEDLYSLFNFGKMLAKQGRYNDSNAMLRQGTLVCNDPMFYVLQGNIN